MVGTGAAIVAAEAGGVADDSPAAPLVLTSEANCADAGGAASPGRRWLLELPSAVAAASAPFCINRSGTMSTAPHKSRAATGRLLFSTVVLRTPLSLWDCH